MLKIKDLFRISNSNITNHSQKVIYESKLPDYIDAANHIQNKEFDAAIKELHDQLKNANPNDIVTLAMIHINLMQAYFKDRIEKEEYFGLSTHHAKEALKCGHNTGLAAFRLITNFEKEKKLKHAIEICKVVTNKDYKFSIHGYKQKPEFQERLGKLITKLEKIGDDSSESFLTEQEKKLIINNSKTRT